MVIFGPFRSPDLWQRAEIWYVGILYKILQESQLSAKSIYPSRENVRKVMELLIYIHIYI